jgi:mannitol/fructose-specific phosphotransferase system IIA component
MLKLARQQILLGQSVTTKADAIALLASKLTDAGLVEAGYVDGMLARKRSTPPILAAVSPFPTAPRTPVIW